MTHPFHPLCGRSFRLETCRHAWGEPLVYFCDEDGHLRRLPASWTDVQEVDPFVATADGRAHFRVKDLVRLTELVHHLKQEDSRCDV